MKHILIMEDNTLLGLEWVDMFESNGHSVTLTNNGDDAIDLLKNAKFDLVITDLFVPNKKGGIHVAGHLLLMETGAPPVIAVTGARRHIDGPSKPNFFLEQVNKLGVSATLEKPFTASELLLTAHELWGRYRGRR